MEHLHQQQMDEINAYFIPGRINLYLEVCAKVFLYGYDNICPSDSFVRKITYDNLTQWYRVNVANRMSCPQNYLPVSQN